MWHSLAAGGHMVLTLLLKMGVLCGRMNGRNMQLGAFYGWVHDTPVHVAGVRIMRMFCPRRWADIGGG